MGAGVLHRRQRSPDVGVGHVDERYFLKRSTLDQIG